MFNVCVRSSDHVTQSVVERPLKDNDPDPVPKTDS